MSDFFLIFIYKHFVLQTNDKLIIAWNPKNYWRLWKRLQNMTSMPPQTMNSASEEVKFLRYVFYCLQSIDEFVFKFCFSVWMVRCWIWKTTPIGSEQNSTEGKDSFQAIISKWKNTSNLFWFVCCLQWCDDYISYCVV